MKTISLTQGKKAIVDDADYESTIPYTWHAVRTTRPNSQNELWYAATSEVTARGIRKIYLHHFLMGRGVLCDHRDGDGLNNTRINLRRCSDSQNSGNQRLSSANTSGFKGVVRLGNRWAARLTTLQFPKGRHIASFTTKEEAAKAYDAAATDYFGEFAKTNESLGLFQDRAAWIKASTI